MDSSNSLCLGSTGPFPHVIYVNLNTMVLGINFNLLVKQLKQIIVIICISNTHSRKCHLFGFLANINWSIEYTMYCAVWMFYIWYSNSPEQTHIITWSPSSLFASVFASSSYAYNANTMDCKIEIDQITACGINNSI
jgi:hypothetical protein